MGDVFDGRVWKEFQYRDDIPFLAAANNFGLMLNSDWFQLHKYSEYSIGVVYTVVLNLPRQKRFKEKNVIVIGLIPGPKEPKQNVNMFLDPLVDELLQLWRGVKLSDGKTYRAKTKAARKQFENQYGAR